MVGLPPSGSDVQQFLRARQQLRHGIDANQWSWRVWLVLSTGLLASSYSIFATTITLPAMAFVYFPAGVRAAILINTSTLVGTLVGQFLFGVLADRYGRMYMYRIGLFLMLVFTLYITFSGTGQENLSFLGLVTVWRCFAGVGSGALCKWLNVHPEGSRSY